MNFSGRSLIIFWISFTNCKRLNETNTQNWMKIYSVLMNPQKKENAVSYNVHIDHLSWCFYETSFFSTLDMLQTRLKKSLCNHGDIIRLHLLVTIFWNKFKILTLVATLNPSIWWKHSRLFGDGLPTNSKRSFPSKVYPQRFGAGPAI